jgi:hypothetical protein
VHRQLSCAASTRAAQVEAKELVVVHGNNSATMPESYRPGTSGAEEEAAERIMNRKKRAVDKRFADGRNITPAMGTGSGP